MTHKPGSFFGPPDFQQLTYLAALSTREQARRAADALEEQNRRERQAEREAVQAAPEPRESSDEMFDRLEREVEEQRFRREAREFAKWLHETCQAARGREAQRRFGGPTVLTEEQDWYAMVDNNHLVAEEEILGTDGSHATIPDGTFYYLECNGPWDRRVQGWLGGQYADEEEDVQRLIADGYEVKRVFQGAEARQDVEKHFRWAKAVQSVYQSEGWAQ
jgi:hypothetical protein